MAIHRVAEIRLNTVRQTKMMKKNPAVVWALTWIGQLTWALSNTSVSPSQDAGMTTELAQTMKKQNIQIKTRDGEAFRRLL